MNKNNHTILISVPFLRNVRHALSLPFLEEVKKYGRIIIVAPFDLSEKDITFLGLTDSVFLKPEIKISKFVSLFSRLSNLIRRVSYFNSRNDYGFVYYRKSILEKLNRSGLFENQLTMLYLITRIIKLIFRTRDSWQLFERTVYKFVHFDRRTNTELKNLNNVIYFQAANWGTQDRVLSYLARNLNWKSVMLPYTTDQVWTVGYFLRMHDIIAAQSRLEKEMAIEIHKIEEGKALEFGNLWFANIRHFQLNKKIKPISDFRYEKRIAYAGVADEFFPLLTELKSVKYIASKFPNYQVIYFPYVELHVFYEIEKKLSEFSNIKVVQHSQSMTDLFGCSKPNIEKEIKSHIEKLQGLDVFVMSYLTSMCLEASLISKCPIIANFIDDFCILNKRNLDLFPKEIGLNALEAKSYDQLIEHISYCLSVPGRSKLRENHLFWDSNLPLEKSVSLIFSKLETL